MTAKRRLGTTGYYVVSILIAVVAMIPLPVDDLHLSQEPGCSHVHPH